MKTILHRERMGSPLQKPGMGMPRGPMGGLNRSGHGMQQPMGRSMDPWAPPSYGPPQQQWGPSSSPLEIMARDFVSCFANDNMDPYAAAIKFLVTMKQQQGGGGYGNAPQSMYGPPQHQPRGGYGQPPPRQYTQGPQQGYGPNNNPPQGPPGPHNSNIGSKRPRRGGPPQQDGNWICPVPECANVNFPRRTVCNRCQAPKPVIAINSLSPMTGSPHSSPPSTDHEQLNQVNTCYIYVHIYCM